MSTTVEITVKTLDSQNHKFDVSDELTVKQFKEKIAETVNVSAEAQRLIYCGRVLQDDKKLSEYGLDKKVVHLVQKLPPSQRPSSTAGGGSTTRSSTGTGGARRSATHPPGGHGSSMYLGALAFPSDVFTPHGTQEMIHTAAHNRLTVVQNMLQRAENCVTRLEDPNAAPTAPSASASSAPGGSETGDSSMGEIDVELGSFTAEVGMPVAGGYQHASDAMAGAVSAAVSGVISAIANAVGNGGQPNITIVQSSSAPRNHPCPHQAAAAASASSAAAAAASDGNARSGASSSAAGSSEASGSAQSTPQGNPSGAPPPDNNESPTSQRSRGTPVSPSAFADALEEVDRLHTRLRPFLTSSAQLMRSDSALVSGSAELAEAQRVYNLVSETMHLLSHAYHGLSDLTLNFSRQPPRSMGVRSLVLQPAAVLHSGGFPIQAQINVMTNHRVSPTSGTSPSSAASQANTTPGEAATTAAGPTPASSAPSATGATPFTLPHHHHHHHHVTQIHPIPFNMGNMGGNLELIMEVGPTGITVENATIGTPTSAAGDTAGESPAGGAGPGMQVLAPEFIQTLMQAVASGMGAGGAATRMWGDPRPASTQAATSTATSSSAASAAGGAGAGPAGQTSQARGNTATHPTTSTQTRSTARPHVHLAPVNWPGPQGFDPFLPCNSHHIQPAIRMQRASTSQARSTGQSTATATSRPTGSQGTRPLVPPSGGILHMIQRMLGDSSVYGATVFDFLNSMPDYSYTQGESLFTDLFVTTARHMTFGDLIQVSLRQSAPLNRLHAPLRTFVSEQLLRGDVPSSESMARAVNLLLRELEPYLEVVQSSQLRDDIDYDGTIQQFLSTRLPEIISFVVSEDSPQFGETLMSMCGRFIRDLASLTLMCCHGGRQGLERILHRYVQVLTGDLEPTVQQWTAANSRLPLRNFVQSLSPTNPELERFLVRSSLSAPLPAAAPPVTPPSTPTAQRTTLASAPSAVPGTNQEEAMECEEEYVLAPEEPTSEAAAPVVAAAPLSTPNSAVDGVAPAAPAPTLLLPRLETQAVCDVVVGSEDWHNGVDPEWVPVIAQDVQRQRRQSEQGPFSDAYLAGMSSKRRKLINSAKPQGTVSQVIAESMAHAATAAGVGGAEQLARAAGADPELQTAYKEEVKKSVSKQLSSNPEYNPERYPNSSKYFKPGGK